MTRAQKIEKYCSWCEKTAADNTVGYDNRVNHNLGPKGYDCGTLLSYALQYAGLLAAGTVFEPNQPDGTWGYDTILRKAGFEKLKFSEGNLQRGDILIKDGEHTELYLGSGIQIGAHSNYDGVQGDSSGQEISKTSMYQNYWDYTYRLKAENKAFNDVVEGDKYFEEIKWCKEAGVFKGFSDGTFRGGEKMTRRAVAIALYRFAKWLKKNK